MNSRQLAKTWPFPRYAAYQKAMRKIAAAWFDEKDLPRSSRYSFILDKLEHWPQNMVLPEVAEYIERGDGSISSRQQGISNFQMNGRRRRRPDKSSWKATAGGQYAGGQMDPVNVTA